MINGDAAMSVVHDQYLKAHDLYDAEHNRFWTRFNLFTGLQLLVIAGFASNYNDLARNKLPAMMFLAIGLGLAIFTILVTWRSSQMCMAMLEGIKAFENDDNSLILFKSYLKYSHVPVGTIARYCFAMSGVLALFWLIFLVVVAMRPVGS